MAFFGVCYGNWWFLAAMTIQLLELYHSIRIQKDWQFLYKPMVAMDGIVVVINAIQVNKGTPLLWISQLFYYRIHFFKKNYCIELGSNCSTILTVSVLFNASCWGHVWCQSNIVLNVFSLACKSLLGPCLVSRQNNSKCLALVLQNPLNILQFSLCEWKEKLFQIWHLK